MSVKLVLRLIRAALGIYGMLYVGLALYKPGTFLSSFAIAVPVPHSSGFREKVIIYGRMVFTCVAVGVLVYLAAFSVTTVIPSDWIEIDEDGEEQSTRMDVHWILTLLGSLGL